jgi:NTP pyrophosphatase (non-canonical NTP hydrolase)
MIDYNFFQEKAESKRRHSEITLDAHEWGVLHAAFAIQRHITHIIDESLIMDGRDMTSTANTVRFVLAGLVGEAGELADRIKKNIFHGVTMERGELEDELGDCWWYLAVLATTHGYKLQEVIDKVTVANPSFANMSQIATYLTHIAQSYFLDTGRILTMNMAKLDARYPDGFVEGGGNR